MYLATTEWHLRIELVVTVDLGTYKWNKDGHEIEPYPDGSGVKPVCNANRARDIFGKDCSGETIHGIVRLVDNIYPEYI